MEQGSSLEANIASVYPCPEPEQLTGSPHPIS
jgi:hypothetical protein